MLETKDSYVSYEMIEIIHGINLKVDPGELVSVIGPNGMGKTAPIKAIMGLVPLHFGSILYDGQDISALPVYKRAEVDVSYVPEGRYVSGGLTVGENLWTGAYRLPDIKRIRSSLQKVYEMLPRLGGRKNQLARIMSGGEQQMLAIGHALMLSPRLLLIDEVSMGLMLITVNTCFRITRELNESSITILMVEQNVNKALKTANCGYVIEAGNIIFEGTSEVLRSNDMVQKAYLGG